MAERVSVREISNEEGQKLLGLVRRGKRLGGHLAAGADGAAVGAGHGRGRNREGVVHQPGPGPGCDLQLQRRRVRLAAPEVRGGRPPKFTLPQRTEIKKVALGRPADRGLPFSTWSLPKLADFLVAEGVVDDISHEGLRLLLREEGVSFQAVKTWKTSTDPDYEAKKNRVLHHQRPPGRRLGGGEQRRARLRPVLPAAWLNRIEAQFTALRYFALDGTTTPAMWRRPA